MPINTHFNPTWNKISVPTTAMRHADFTGEHTTPRRSRMAKPLERKNEQGGRYEVGSPIEHRSRVDWLLGSRQQAKCV